MTIQNNLIELIGFLSWIFHWSLFVSKDPDTNTSFQVQVITRRLLGTKPLTEPMMTQLADAYIGVTKYLCVLNTSCVEKAFGLTTYVV